MRDTLWWISLLTVCLLVACERDVDSSSSDDSDIESVDDDDDVDEYDDLGNLVDHDDADDYIWDSTDITSIEFNESTITVTGDGATVDASVVTISSAGNYELSGSLSDGQVIVDTDDDDIVRVILNGVDIYCSSNAAIYVKEAAKTMIVLTEDTENYISDGSTYSSDEEDANAAIYSSDDLTVYGNGSLIVDANHNDGITSKDGLIITSGTIEVNAVDDGIRGKDYLVINGGVITVVAKGDGLKSDNDEDTAKGYVSIAGGTLNISSDGDGIQAETDVLIYDGELDIYAGGGSDESVSSYESAKGIKSGVSTIIYDGVLSVDAADDGLHSDGDQTIYNGFITVESGDDGIHSDNDLNIEDGDIYISESYEGLESSSGDITINGGNIWITSSDDGINVSAGGDSSESRKSTTSTSSSYTLNISDGYIYIYAGGDGLDSNDDMDITGGIILVNASSSSSNSALDCDGTCTVDGGFLLALGMSQMAEAPASSSDQCALLVNLKNTLSAGKLIHIEDAEGNDLLTYKSVKSFDSVVFSSSELSKGSTYKFYYGGSSSGTSEDGLYTSGSYTPGTLYTSFTISQTITTIN